MIYNNDRDPNEEMWEKQNKLTPEEMVTETQKLIIQKFGIQEEKIKVLTDFLEYEEALTKDKETANRIRIILKEFGVWN
jgi:hypothetical protein